MTDEWTPCPDCRPTDDGGFTCARHQAARVVVPEPPPLSALEWLRVTHAGTLSGQRIEEALADARADAEQLRERTGVVVAALVARAELAEAALRRVGTLIQTFDIAQPRIAADLRAALDNGR